jgi:hypothetical protein
LSETGGGSPFNFKLKDWAAVAGIAGIGITQITTLMNPAIWPIGVVAIIVLGLIGLYVVKRATRVQEIQTRDKSTKVEVEGNVHGLQDLLHELKNMRNKTLDHAQCNCYDETIDFVAERIKQLKRMLRRMKG